MSLFSQNFLLRLSTTYLKLFNKNEVISFPEAVRSAKIVLLLLPTNEEDFLVACRTLGRFQKTLDPKEVFAFVHESMIEHIPEGLKNRLIVYSKNSITALCRPSKELMNKLKKIGIDMIINLNPTFNLFFAKLSLLSKAKLRICFHNNKYEEYFFNCEINDTKHSFLDQRYSTILKYLSFMAGTPQSHEQIVS